MKIHENLRKDPLGDHSPESIFPSFRRGADRNPCPMMSNGKIPQPLVMNTSLFPRKRANWPLDRKAEILSRAQKILSGIEKALKVLKINENQWKSNTKHRYFNRNQWKSMKICEKDPLGDHSPESIFPPIGGPASRTVQARCVYGKIVQPLVMNPTLFPHELTTWQLSEAREVAKDPQKVATDSQKSLKSMKNQ